MILKEETKVAQTALPLETFKQHLRLGTGFAADAVQDAVLEGYLRAALAAIEGRTGKALIAREFSCRFNVWRDEAGQSLPLAPVKRILELSVVDADDNLTIVPAERYRLSQDFQRPRILTRGSYLPTIPQDGFAEIYFIAGFAEDWAGLPEDLAQAVLLLAAHFYEFRHHSAEGSSEIPFGVDCLIERYRTVRSFGRIGACAV